MTAAEHQRAGVRPNRLGIWLAIGIVFALCDFLLPPSITAIQDGGRPPAWKVALALYLFGCTLAQGNLLAAWLVWSSEPFLPRLARHWLAAAILYLCWLPGLAMSARVGDFKQLGQMVGVMVPAVSLGAQLPHWIVRHFFGWRLVRYESALAARRNAPLTIRDLILATIIVAVTFRIARRLPRIVPEMNVPWMFVALCMTIAAVISMIGLLPAGPLLMRIQPFQRGLFWGSVYSAALVSIVWIIVVVQWWYAPAGLAPHQAYVGLSTLMLGYAATLMTVAGCARADGYRLVIGRGARPGDRDSRSTGC